MEQTVTFHGTYISYQGERISLNENTFFLDGRLEKDAVSQYAHVYRDLPALLQAVNQKKAEKENRVTVYIAPYVYWLYDPQSRDIVSAKEGYDVPYGAVIDCDALRFVGLCQDAGQVVFAANRGQSHGAVGNYTMFYFRVRDLEMENMTLGNYCSVDLIYPWKPELGRERRTATITQAQLAKQSGDKFFARNCRFVSRLNLYPVSGGKRCLYENCHFESTDDSLNGHAVYVGCDFDFYGNRPLYDAKESGAVFLNCLFRGRMPADSIEKEQYFTKEGGQVVTVDCRYEEDPAMERRIGWTKYPLPSLKCYQYHMKENGTPIMIGGEGAAETVTLEGKALCGAYRLEKSGAVIYNTYNLLRGEDDWDPLGTKEAALEAGKDSLPTCLLIKAERTEIVSGETQSLLQGEAFFFYGKKAEGVEISYYVEEKDQIYVKLSDHGDGSCMVEGSNEEDTVRRVMIHAVTPEGLEGAVELQVSPHLLEAPLFRKKPVIEERKPGVCEVCYELEKETYADQSRISWWRCEDSKSAILVAVSRGNEPMREYPLTREDAGYYLMAVVEPKHSRSKPGEGVKAVTAFKITAGGEEHRDTEKLKINFANFPACRQEKILPGFWTADVYRPKDTLDFGKWEESKGEDPWKYGKTGNGSIGVGLYQNVQGARLLYTPLEGVYGDMTLHLKADPAKTAGQGFGSAGQYMDLCIKFDTASLSGYGVRILRKREAADGVWFLPIQYEKGEVRALKEGILTSCYHTGCNITLQVRGNCLTVHGESETVKGSPTKYASVVDLAVQIPETPFGGVAIQHTGTPGTGGWQNTTMLHLLEIEWKGVIDHERDSIR